MLCTTVEDPRLVQIKEEPVVHVYTPRDPASNFWNACIIIQAYNVPTRGSGGITPQKCWILGHLIVSGAIWGWKRNRLLLYLL